MEVEKGVEEIYGERGKGIIGGGSGGCKWIKRWRGCGEMDREEYV